MVTNEQLSSLESSSFLQTFLPSDDRIRFMTRHTYPKLLTSALESPDNTLNDAADSFDDRLSIILSNVLQTGVPQLNAPTDFVSTASGTKGVFRNGATDTSRSEVAAVCQNRASISTCENQEMSVCNRVPGKESRDVRTRSKRVELTCDGLSAAQQHPSQVRSAELGSIRRDRLRMHRKGRVPISHKLGAYCVLTMDPLFVIWDYIFTFVG